MADCFKRIRDITPDSVDDDTIKRIVAEVESIKKGLLGATNIRTRFRETTNDLRQLELQQSNEKLEEVAKLQRIFEILDQPAFKDDPVEGVKALLTGASRLSVGGNLSVGRIATVIRGENTGFLVGRLEEEGLLQITKSGSLDREMMIELWELRPGGRSGKSGSDEAVRGARIFRDTQKLILRQIQESGGQVRELTGYIMRQSHDPGKLHTARFDAWFDDINARLDPEKTFGSFKNDKAQVREFMQEAFNDIVNGKHTQGLGSETGDEILKITAPGDINRRISKSRVLHFKDGEKFFEYNQKFGTRKLLESVMSSIDQNARNSSLMRVFGTNPRRSLERIRVRLRSELKGDLKKQQKFDSAFPKDLNKISEIGNIVRTAEGLTDIVGFNMLARGGSIVRASLDGALLGNAGVASTTDWATAAVTVRNNIGDNLLEAHLDLSKSFIAVLPRNERVRWARRTQVFIEDISGSALSRMSIGEGDIGTASKLRHWIGKASGLSLITSAGKVATARLFAIRLADFAAQSFGDLRPRLRASLQRFEIDEIDWDLMRRTVEKFDDDIEAITAEGILTLPDNVIQGAIAKKGKRQSIVRFKNDLRLKIGAFFSEAADDASPTPGLRERAILTQGISPNEPMGQVLRFWAQFKSFPLTMHRVMKRTLLSNPQKSAKTATEAVFKGQGDLEGLAGMVGSMTVMGYVALTLVDLAKGKAPRDPTDPKVWAESFTKGGSGGLYGDLLFLESKREFQSFVFGPGISRGFDIADVFIRAKNGDKAAGKALNLMINSVPGRNLFYTRAALDYLILFRIQEALNPGYLVRLENRIHQNPGLLDERQEFFLGSPLQAGR